MCATLLRMDLRDTIPALLSKVKLRHRGDVYLVVDLDKTRNVVDVISITGDQHLIPDVPFAAIQELVEPPPDYL
jgi:hypothetical protein